MDLRTEGSTKFIAEIEGRKLKSKTNAAGFMECSAKTKQGLTEVFEESVRFAMATSSQTSECTLS